MRRPLPILALCAALTAGPAGAQDAVTEGRVIVTGEGSVAAVPDLAVLRLGAQAEAEEAQAALDAASEAARALTRALREAGVADADLQTSELILSPRYDDRGDPEAVAGYVASNVVTARVRDLDALGAVIGAAAEAGANRIDGLSFMLSDPGPAREEARRRAVADAMAAAETLADAAGRALGPALRIEEGGGGPRPFPADAMLRAEVASVPIERGEVETSASVRMEFGLAPFEDPAAR